MKAGDLIAEGGILAEEFLDMLGTAVVKLLSLLGYPIKAYMPIPEIFQLFTGKTLPQSLPLIFVLHIILLVYSTYVLCYMPAVGLGFESAESISFHLVTALSIISYYRGVTTDPGLIPEGPEFEKANEEFSKAQGLRWCNREKKFKPERTHFCSAMGRNVLKMDHYCPWLANCVGYFNYKFFLLFIVYASIACGWTTISVAQLLAKSSAGFLPKSATLSAAQIFFLTEGLCISSLVSLILTPFTGFHLYLLSQNKTTLEYCEKANSKTSYDFGPLHNIASAIGWNPILWFLPIQTAPGDGLTFQKRTKTLPPDHSSASPEDEEIDEDEVRIQKEIAQRVGLSVDEQVLIIPPAHQSRGGRGCCIRRWDTPDTPLVQCTDSTNTFIDSIVDKFYSINGFRETLQNNFTKIVSGDTTPRKEEFPEALAATSDNNV